MIRVLLIAITLIGCTGPTDALIDSQDIIQVFVYPTQVHLKQGEAQRFQAFGRTPRHDSVSVHVTWIADGGTISSDGTFVADTVVGEHYIVASHSRRTWLSDTALVSVERPRDAPSTWIYAGQDIQAVVDAHPAGTEFVLKAGTHRIQQVSPKEGDGFIGEVGAVLSGARLLAGFLKEGAYWVATGQTQEGDVHGVCHPDYPMCNRPEDLFFDDVPLLHVSSIAELGSGKWYFDYATDKIYFADDPTGHKIETSVTRNGFLPAADNVTVRNLIVEKYANPAQVGAVQAGGTEGWVIESNEIRLNHGVGVKFGHRARVVGNNVHHNGQLGIGGIGDDVLVEDNEIAYNNTAGFDRGWEAGGTKFVQTHNLVVRNNHVHHNNGLGLWTDGDNIYTLYEGNVTEYNVSDGIAHEISYNAVIRNNIVRGNGYGRASWLWGAGILVHNSPDVEIYGNTVVDNYNGITAIQQDRSPGVYGPHDVVNLYVHDNYVDMTNSNRTGMTHDTDDDSIYSRNNRFQNNTYILSDATYYFSWMKTALDELGWQAFGHDTTGTFIRP